MAGKELVIDYELNGNRFSAINAGPQFKFNESVSFAVFCKDQEEIDYFWEKLSAVPESEQCGWCKDKFGLSWQIVPEGMEETMKKPGAYAKMMQMKKIVIADF
jgi:predicted 3-demethylubiquinone-9 3-methyltransferase (glyoxalase superfamily)